jgi:hypothetical protein
MMFDRCNAFSNIDWHKKGFSIINLQSSGINKASQNTL